MHELHVAPRLIVSLKHSAAESLCAVYLPRGFRNLLRRVRDILRRVVGLFLDPRAL